MATTPEAWKNQTAEDAGQQDDIKPAKKDVRQTFYFDRETADILRELRRIELREDPDTSMSRIVSEAVLGMGDPPGQALDVMERIRGWAAERAPAMKAPPERTQEREPASTVPTLPAVSTSALRVPVEVVDDMMRIGGETTINVGLVQSHLTDMLKAMADLNQQNLLVQQRVFDLENLIDIRGIPGNRVAAISDGGGGSGAVEGDFDPLELDQYNELHSLPSSVSTATAILAPASFAISVGCLSIRDSVSISIGTVSA